MRTVRQRRGRLWLVWLAVVLCLAGCAYEEDVSPTAAYDGTWYFAVNGAQCQFTDGQIYRYDKNVLDGQSLTGIYSPAGDHIDANVAYIGSLDQVRPLYIVSGEDGDFLCDKADGSGTVYFYREATAYLSTLEAAETAAPEEGPAEEALPSQAPEEGQVLTLEPQDLEEDGEPLPPGSRVSPAADTEAPTATESKGGGMVWIPQSGSKYHSTPSCSGMKDPTQVSLSEAQSRGYTACKRCN